MSNSPLVTKNWPAYYSINNGNYTKGRESKIWGIIIHHGATTSLDSIGRTFSTPGRMGSAHYGVDGNNIHQYVDESDTSWHCGDYYGNHGTVGIETTNSTGAPSWLVSDATFNTLVKLVADIAKRNNLGVLKFEPDGYCPNLSAHRDWAQTFCVPIWTEVLTKDGWKAISEVDIGEDIATVILDGLQIKFSPVLDKVPEKTQDTWELRDIEVTADHRMLWKTQRATVFNRVTEYQDIPNNQAVYIPNAGFYSGPGLPLSDNEIRLLVAVQADGHYEKGQKSGKERVTFHVSKERKVALLDDILSEYDHKKYQHADGTVSYNVKGIKPLCEEYLEDKNFTYRWLELSPEQAKLFLDVILDFDGCRAGCDYSSCKKQNIDVVSAIAALNGIGTASNGSSRVRFTKSYRSIDKREGANRHQQTTVSCVTVESGFILVRQHGRTAVIGNCPGDYLYSKMTELAKRANEINYPPAKPKISWTDLPKALGLFTARSCSLVDLDTGKAVKTYSANTKIDVVQSTEFNGVKYYRTEYSKTKGFNWAFKAEDFAEPEVVAEPTPIEEEPSAPIGTSEIPQDNKNGTNTDESPSQDGSAASSKVSLGKGGILTAIAAFLKKIIKLLTIRKDK